MQDLNDKVQSVAKNFYETRDNKSFTKFYITMLPEANKMLKSFIKDAQTAEDISSKIFETILVKPSIYLTECNKQKLKEIAMRRWDIDESKCCYYSSGIKKISSELEYIKCNQHCKTKNCEECEKLRTNLSDPRVAYCYGDLATTLMELDTEDSKPFVFDPDRPFLHYFSKIIKTNALSHLKKNKKFLGQQFAELNAEDEDRPQSLTNQLSDESEKNDVICKEQNRQIGEQKFMIVYDIIQQTVPENQRGIMIDAILMKMDYKDICSKYHLETVGCVKSRVHRFRKRLDCEVAKTPQFTSQCNIDVFTTYYSNKNIHIEVDIVEFEVDGIMQNLWHGRYICYYSTGQVKEMGRYFLGKRQGDWYSYYKDGQVMKRGMYQADKQDGNWHQFDYDGILNTMYNYHNGVKEYYESIQENGRKISGFIDEAPKVKREPKPPINEIIASKLCSKYDNEFSYSTLQFEIS